jgi:hypothetical protein
MGNKSGRTKRPLCQVFYEGFSRARRGAGLKARALMIRKKYPLINFDERVSLRHLNLMTLSFGGAFFTFWGLEKYAEV